MAITISGSGITSANIADGTITNGDIHPSAAIDGSKLTGVTPTKSALEAIGIAASSITGALPAISGAALTNLPSSPSIGVGQTWQTVSRSSNVNYTNTTGKPIYCSIQSGSVQNPGMNFYVGGTTRAYHSTNAGGRFFICCVVPAGQVYKMTGSVGTWWELR